MWGRYLFSALLLWIYSDPRIPRIPAAYPILLMKNISTENGQAPIQLPGGGNVVLRSVTPKDDEFLLGLYASSREEELAQVVWPEGQKEAFVRWQFEMQRREYDQRYPDARYDVILVDGYPVGRIWIGTDDEQIRLLDIALLKDFQNRGLGTLLLRRLMDEAASSNKLLRHMVFTLNNNAHRFYERLGFVVIEDVGAYKHMEWRGEDYPQITQIPQTEL